MATPDFAPLDARARVLQGHIFPVSDKRSEVTRVAAVSDLGKVLVTDSYGGGANLRKVCWDAYNTRRDGRTI